MNTENRDFVIERLERQLSEKEDEIETIKKTLRESILHELRNDIKNDLEINNRLIKVEQSIKEVTNNINGIMDELFDQKSQIRDLKRICIKGDKIPAPAHKRISGQADDNVVSLTNGSRTTRSSAPFTDSLFSTGQDAGTVKGNAGTVKGNAGTVKGNAGTVKGKGDGINVTPIAGACGNRQKAVPGQWESFSDRSSDRSVVKMEIQDINEDSEKPVIELNKEGTPSSGGSPENIVRSEYIVADSKDIPKRTPSQKDTPVEKCEYIVAEESDSKRSKKESEYETVEDREDEDTVITIMRKK